MENQLKIFAEKTEGVAYVYLNRPDKHNAFDADMIISLSKTLNDLAKDPDLRAIVIRGKGKSFSSGADLNYMNSMVNASKSDNLEDAVRLATLFDTIYNCPVPVISVAHGNISGGALGIIAASDLVICSTNSVFRFSELKLGLIPATISPYIIKRIGELLASELMFTGRSFSGTDACKYGLANHAVEEDEMESVLNSILEEMKSSGPVALRKTKLLIHSVSGKEIDSEIRRFTSRVIADVRVSTEAKEGMQAFLEKRKPNWLK